MLFSEILGLERGPSNNAFIFYKLFSALQKFSLASSDFLPNFVVSIKGAVYLFDRIPPSLVIEFTYLLGF